VSAPGCYRRLSCRFKYDAAMAQRPIGTDSGATLVGHRSRIGTRERLLFDGRHGPPCRRTKVFVLEVRISGKWGSNQAKCRPLGNRPFTWVFAVRTKTPKSAGPERIGLRRAIFGRLRAGPVNRSTPKTPGKLPLSVAVGEAESTARMGTGGGGATRYRRSLGWSLGERRAVVLRMGHIDASPMIEVCQRADDPALANHATRAPLCHPAQFHSQGGQAT